MNPCGKKSVVIKNILHYLDTGEKKAIPKRGKKGKKSRRVTQ